MPAPSTSPREHCPGPEQDPTLRWAPVSVAFAVGWQMAELYGGSASEVPPERDGPDKLPSLEDLGGVQLATLGVDQVDAALHLLSYQLDAAGVSGISTQPVRTLLAAKPLHLDTLRDAVERLHVGLMLGLTAADFRLGKAYRLGCSLAKTALLPEDRDSFEYAFGPRIDSIKDWLADLTSTLPAHGARAVAASLAAWDKWAAEPAIDGREFNWEDDWPAVRPVLRRQGQLWRALLSDEKQGADMLEIQSLVSAGQGMLAQASSLAWRALRRLWLGAVIVTVLLGSGIALLVLAKSEVLKISGAIVAAAGSVGITWRGLMTRASKMATEIESRLWGAELDLAIAVVITKGPDGWGVDVADVAKALPAVGEGPHPVSELAILDQFRAAVKDERLEKPKPVVRAARFLTPDSEHLHLPTVLDANKPSAEELLNPYVRFVPGPPAGEEKGRTMVLTWLKEQDHRNQIDSDPQETLAAGQGRYVSLQRESPTGRPIGGEYWIVRHGSIMLWERHADVNDARAAAGLPAA